MAVLEEKFPDAEGRRDLIGTRGEALDQLGRAPHGRHELGRQAVLVVDLPDRRDELIGGILVHLAQEPDEDRQPPGSRNDSRMRVRGVITGFGVID